MQGHFKKSRCQAFTSFLRILGTFSRLIFQHYPGKNVRQLGEEGPMGLRAYSTAYYLVYLTGITNAKANSAQKD